MGIPSAVEMPEPDDFGDLLGLPLIATGKLFAMPLRPLTVGRTTPAVEPMIRSTGLSSHNLAAIAINKRTQGDASRHVAADERRIGRTCGMAVSAV
jgi:hypothetical protein